MNKEYAAHWIVERKVFEHIFGVNPHLMVIKRTTPILDFLKEEGMLTMQTLDYILNCCSGGSEEIVTETL